MACFETVTDLEGGADVLRRRRYGRIEIVEGRLVGVHLRPFPARAWWWQPLVTGRLHHAFRRGDRCELFYNQPRGWPDFLALVYVRSARDTSLASFRQATLVLEAIARIKGSHALLCEAANRRISDRLLRRWGWTSHAPMLWHRNFIKRLYDVNGLAPQATSGEAS